ncbi:hypothetical protein [Halostella salina]|uniref:hypothetical protein n=1 Tax=Halostella salina TaxID=1547897 RepID=UPI000EF7C61D|nr:hypothetical protein [Halostella salina]
MTGYYDLVLGLIPVALLGFTGALTVAGLNLTTAVPIAASVPVALMGHAMFVNGPTDEPAPSTNTNVGPVNAD